MLSRCKRHKWRSRARLITRKRAKPVMADGSGFKLKINKITESVAHLHYDVFQVPDAPFDPFAKLKVSFFSDANGDISTLALPLETNVKDIVFTRLPDKQLTERSF